MQTGERDRLVKSILQSHWDDFELIKLDGGMVSLCFKFFETNRIAQPLPATYHDEE